MVNEFHQRRAFVLEAMVVVILLIEIVFCFAEWPARRWGPRSLAAHDRRSEDWADDRILDGVPATV
jgi:hypothetical protein